jgi:hypothetical protein
MASRATAQSFKPLVCLRPTEVETKTVALTAREHESDEYPFLRFIHSIASRMVGGDCRSRQGRRCTSAVATHETSGHTSEILVENRHRSIRYARWNAIVRLSNSTCNAGQRVAVSSERYRISYRIFEVRRLPQVSDYAIYSN